MGLIVIKVMMSSYCRCWEFWEELMIAVKLFYAKAELSSLIERPRFVDCKDVTIMRFLGHRPKKEMPYVVRIIL